MAEIMRLLADAAFGIAAGKRQPPALDPEKPREHPQQRGFARAVAPGHGQRLPGRQLEAQPGKDLAPAALADEILAPQASANQPCDENPDAAIGGEMSAMRGVCCSLSFIWNA